MQSRATGEESVQSAFHFDGVLSAATQAEVPRSRASGVVESSCVGMRQDVSDLRSAKGASGR